MRWPHFQALFYTAKALFCLQKLSLPPIHGTPRFCWEAPCPAGRTDGRLLPRGLTLPTRHISALQPVLQRAGSGAGELGHTGPCCWVPGGCSRSFLCFPGTSLNLAGETAETSPDGRENKSRSAKTRQALRQWCPWHDSGVEQRSAGSLALPAPHPRPFASSPPYLPHHVRDLF